MDIIEVKNVTKRFKSYADKAVTLKEKAIFKKRRKFAEREVLKNINVSISNGEVVGLIGENGCGKSTLLKLLTGIMYPEEGTITVDGRVSSLIELGAGFHPDMSGRDNVYTNAAIFGLSKKETDKRFQDILDFSELHEFIDNPVRTYSSGMYMRLAFSVAINVDADILLIDEILAVGDANFKAKCFNKLDSLKAQGKTIVIVTHDIGTVERFCTRALWLNNGRIAKSGDRYRVVEAYLAYMAEKRERLFDNGKDFDKDDVFLAYNYLLQRLPDSEETVNNACNIFRNRQELAESIIESAEFAERAENNDFKGVSTERAFREFEAYRYTKRHEAQAEEARTESGDEFSDEIVGETETHMRFGNGKAVILDAAFLSAGENSADTLRGGQQATLKIDYKINEEVQHYIFGFDIFTVDDIHCYGTSMNADGYIFTSAKEQGSVYCALKDMNLAPGEYFLNVFVLDNAHNPLDYIKRYRTFYVTGEEKSTGIVTFRHEWSVN